MIYMRYKMYVVPVAQYIESSMLVSYFKITKKMETNLIYLLQSVKFKIFVNNKIQQQELHFLLFIKIKNQFVIIYMIYTILCIFKITANIKHKAKKVMEIRN